ncbi:MAG: TetR/AcrR family transcriptional regulator [Hyphomicrobiaceae bacterium]
MSETRDKLMDAAESGMRLRGYHAVSFRELADELGIKSASVHYHFRAKEDMGLALVARYAQRFFAALEAKAARAETPDARVRAFAQVYRDALVGSDRICLCGMLGAESCGLPAVVSAAVAGFFESNIAWLVDALPTELSAAHRRKRARHIVAALQGGMMLASSLNDHRVFDSVVQDLLAA